MDRDRYQREASRLTAILRAELQNKGVSIRSLEQKMGVGNSVYQKLLGGKITVTLANAGKDPHQFEVPDLNVSTGNIPGGTTTSVSFQIPTGVGSYAFDCAYHTSEHMVGTLTVVGF